MPSFRKIVQAVKKLNSISRERLNFRRRPILCTTLYRNLMQAPNFGGTFDQLFLWIFSWNFHRRCLSTFSIPWCKKVKNDQKLKSRGVPPVSESFLPPDSLPWLLLCRFCSDFWSKLVAFWSSNSNTDTDSDCTRYRLCSWANWKTVWHQRCPQIKSCYDVRSFLWHMSAWQELNILACLQFGFKEWSLYAIRQCWDSDLDSELN